MKILLDTHVLYWWFVAPERLGGEAVDQIANPKNDVLISTVGGFELLQKQRAGKLAPELDVLHDLMGGMEFTLCILDSSALAAYRDLPSLSWRDPFDHLLMAQSIAQSARFCTADRRILEAAVPALGTINAEQ